MTALTIDVVIDHYIKLRDSKSALKAEYDKQVKEVELKMNKFEAYLLQQADAQGVTSFKTKNGTAFVTTVDMANVADWDAVLKFIKDNDAWDMLEKRVSKTAVRQYIEATKAIPSGVNWATRLDINVRRAPAGGDE
tara:strand:- start:2722 stop:3129 length:408 start_codon:yes stop_codon:yes gene_type:complete